MTFLEKLIHAQRRSDSLLCVGLDTDMEKIPASLRSRTDPLVEFNRRIIDATKDLVCAYKLNIAFYESAGEHMWRAVRKTLGHIPDGIVTIGDGKRGDIGNTSERQAHMFFGEFEFTACTVSPYMGRDSLEPFMAREDRGAFILALTSNEGSKDFQYLKVSGRPLYEHVVAKALKWNKKGNLGLVVGATHPKELKRIRGMAPDLPILIPGVGAQKGNLASAVRCGCGSSGLLAVINVGRSVIYASSGDDFDEKARDAALKYREEMNAARRRYFR
jgi:orotidine-5'-phosphate decarboxylase